MKKKGVLKEFAEKIQPRDIIAVPTLVYCLYLINQGINHIVSGITIMITTYYFSKRVFEERNKR